MVGVLPSAQMSQRGQVQAMMVTAQRKIVCEQEKVRQEVYEIIHRDFIALALFAMLNEALDY